MIIQVGSTGLNTDVAPALLPPDAITHGDNFLCVAGSVRSPRMRIKRFQVTVEPVYHFTWTTVDNEHKLIVSDGETVLLYDMDGTGHDLNPSARFTPGSLVTFTDLNTVLVVNSNEDGPFYYDSAGTGELAALPGWTATDRCRVMASLRYSLVALNMTEDGDLFPQKLLWSNSAQDGDLPTLWAAAADNDAGDDLLGESGGHITGAEQMRGSLWVLKSDSIYEMAWIGGQYVFAVNRRTGIVGGSGNESLVACKNVLAVLSRDDVYLYDGSTANSISDNRVHSNLVSLSENGAYTFIELKYSPNQDFLLVSLSADGVTAETTLIYSFADNTWSRVNFGSVYGFELSSFEGADQLELLVLRQNEGAFWVESFADQYDSEQASSYVLIDGNVERRGIKLGEQVSVVEKVLPVARGATFSISFGVQETQDADPRWTPYYTVTPSVREFIPVRLSGSYFCWRVNAASYEPWYLDALDVRVRPAGDKE